MTRSSVLGLLLLGAFAAPAAAQFPPERATNLRVLPKDIPMDSLTALMASFTRALGVRCDFCHVQREGQTFQQINFALDDNATKDKAREMLRMVAAINGEHLPRLASRRTPEIRVTCATCHRGVSQPRPIQQVVLNAYAAAGADSAEATYRALRERYLTSGSYNFGEVSLADVADGVAARGNVRDAVRFHALNTQMNPSSTFALRQLAQTHLRLSDTAGAIGAYERAVAINGDPQSRRALEALKRR